MTSRPTVLLCDDSRALRMLAARQLDASALIKELVSPLIKGGGGGQKNLATAGGQEVGQLDEVIRVVRERVSKA